MIVVDSNVLAYLLLPSDYNTAAQSLLERDSKWAAPRLWRSEFRNVLFGNIRRGGLTFRDALFANDRAMECWREGNMRRTLRPSFKWR